MKKKLAAILAGLLCAFYMLNSCSGHIVHTAPKEREKVNTPPLSALWSENGVHQKSLVLSPDGDGDCGGAPLSWETDGKMITVRFHPACCVGRSYSFFLTRSGALPSLQLRMKRYIPYFMSAPFVRTEQQAANKVTEEEPLYTEGQMAAGLSYGLVGQKYKYGGKSPETGFDCSGLVWYVYSQLGYTLERVANYQAKQGILIDEEDIQPGDILCFGAPGYVGHVGIYIGEGWYVHAMGAEFGVVMNSLDDPYLKRTYEIRRIVGCDWLKSENVAAGMLPPEDA